MATQRSFSNAVKWAYTANWGEKAFSAIFTFILAALLGPQTFGTVSIGLVYVGFLQMLLDQGLVSALVQRKDLEHEHLDVVFWTDLSLSGFLVLVSALLGRWWATVNHAPEAAAIIPALSLCIVIEGLSLVQKALLIRNMDFKSLSIRSNASVLVSGAIGVGMAYMGFGIWALVAQQLVRDLLAVILLWRLSPWRPRLSFSRGHLSDLMGFSISNFIAQLAGFADTQIGPVLLGLLFGPMAVGLYRLADRFMNCVVVMATSSIQSVALPEFSRLQDRPQELRRSALSCIRMSATITLPLLAGMAVVSRPLMETIGPKWIPAADALKILCILGMSIIFAYFTGPLMQALAKTREIAALEWARTIVGMGALVAAGLLVRNASVGGQIMGIALARCICGACLVTPVFAWILMRLCTISLREFARCVAPSILASLSVAGSVILAGYSTLLANARPIGLLISYTAVGGVVGSVVLVALDRGLRHSISRMFAHSPAGPRLIES
jgi:O-antigen/teichoic acid export membrane protein